jgi:hypothetical protein
MNEGRCKKVVPLRCKTHQMNGLRRSDSLPAMNTPRKQKSRHFISQRSRFRNIARFCHSESTSNLLMEEADPGTAWVVPIHTHDVIRHHLGLHV